MQITMIMMIENDFIGFPRSAPQVLPREAATAVQVRDKRIQVSVPGRVKSPGSYTSILYSSISRLLRVVGENTNNGGK